MATTPDGGESIGGRGYNFKVVLLGEGCVGKTSLVVRYVEDVFNTKHVTTLQASFLNKKLSLAGRRVHLSIWDTAGQERFHALGPIYYRASNGAVLVYDVTDQDSFEKAKNWVKELRKMLGADICLTIVGNKIDLQKEQTVDTKLAEEYAASVGASHFHTSAKLNAGIEEMFLELCKRMLEQAQKEAEQRMAADFQAASSPRRNVVVVEDGEEALESSGRSACC
ncbi:ras-related protein Rab-21 [Cloeon dipterum]|uniref:ras-related protein Rab-21 n=1 Tax=Cloeon dipterum TaxID=197152 RepID=UPI00322078AA